MIEATTQPTTAAQSTDAALNAFLETLCKPQADAFRELWAAQRAENEQLREELSAKDERIEGLEEYRTKRYEILRDVVAAKTDLDAETIDRLVNRRMQRGDAE
jgi:flagellar motility protein MotE (MotC chaperone)